MLPVDLSSPQFIADPYPTYQRIRQAGPLFALMPGAWLATRYRVADAILRDARFGKDFLSGVARRYGPERAQEPLFVKMSRSLLLMNPPEHTRLRSLVGKAFSVKQAGELRRLAEQVARRLFDGFCATGHADLVAAFAYPLPVMVIYALLGIRQDDALLFQRESHALIKIFELAPLSDAELATASAAGLMLEEYFSKHLAQRRRQPGDDLMSLLLKTEEGDDRLSEEEIIANIMLFYMAGHETTANMIGNALLALFRHPEQLALLRSDWSLLPLAVDEALRYESSVQLAARVALQDVEVEGVSVAQGDTVYINVGAANRDPDIFADPDNFIIQRQATSAKPLSFGGGAHYCLGARLARIELETALTLLLQELPDLRLEDLATPCWRPTGTVRGVENLWAAWNP